MLFLCHIITFHFYLCHTFVLILSPAKLPQFSTPTTPVENFPPLKPQHLPASHRRSEVSCRLYHKSLSSDFIKSIFYLLQPHSTAPHSININRRHAPKVHRATPGLVLHKLPQSVNYRNHKASISSGPIGSYGPSFISRITEPDSKALTVCHCPAGTFKATTCPPGLSSIASVQMRSSSS